MMRILTCIAIIGTPGFGYAAIAQSIRATASATSIQIAEPIEINIIVTAPETSKVTLPGVGAQIGQWEVVGSSDRFDIPSSESDQRTWSRRLMVETLFTGTIAFPSIEAIVRRRDQEVTLRSDPIDIVVNSVLAADADVKQIRDLRPELVLPENARARGFAWLAGLLGCVVFAIAGWWATRRRGILPQRWALAELDQLQRTIDPASLRSEALASGVTRIMCEYLRLRFREKRFGATLSEWARTLKSGGVIDASVAVELDALSAMADQTRFAGVVIDEREQTHLIERCRHVIDRIAAMQSSPAASSPTVNEVG